MYDVGSRFNHGIGQFAMQISFSRSKLQHVAKHRDPSPAFAHRTCSEHVKGCAHRDGIGVIGFVDQEKVPVRQRQT